MDYRDDSCLLNSAGEEYRADPAALCKVVLINPYELGRQPFGLAEPSAWLKQAGFNVQCIDLSLQKLDPGLLSGAKLVAVSTSTSGPPAIFRSTMKSKLSSSACPAARSGRYQPLGGAGRRFRCTPSSMP